MTLVYLLPLIKCNKNGTGSLSDNVSLQTDIQTLKKWFKICSKSENLKCLVKITHVFRLFVLKTLRKMHFTDIEVNNTKLW